MERLMIESVTFERLKSPWDLMQVAYSARFVASFLILM